MHTEQEKLLYEKLLQTTAESRFRTFKAIWQSTPAIGAEEAPFKDLISRELTRLRKDIFKVLTSKEISSAHPIIREIIDYEGIPLIRKNIAISAIYGLAPLFIADLNCVNLGYVSMCIKTLKEEYPELFR